MLFICRIREIRAIRSLGSLEFTAAGSVHRAKSQIPISKSQTNLNAQVPKAEEPRMTRITRIGKNCIPNISAIRVIRGHLNRQIPKAEEPRMTRSGSAATEGFNHGLRRYHGFHEEMLPTKHTKHTNEAESA